MRIYKPFFISVMLLLLMLKLSAGWLISEVSTDSFGNKKFQTTFIQAKQLRFETATSITIIDLEQHTATLIFSEFQAYWSGTVDEFKQHTLDEIKIQVDMVIAHVPESERPYYDELYQKLLNHLNGTVTQRKPIVQIKKTGISDTISEHLAYEHEVFVDSILRERIWITNDLKPYREINIDALIDFTNQLSPFEIRNNITQSEAYANLLKTGMPLRSVEYDENGVKNSTDVVRIVERELIATLFEVPNNYRKVGLRDILYMDIIDEGMKQEFK